MHRLPIRDQEALGRVLRHLEHKHGSQAKAAEPLGLSQGSFSKLAAGKRREIHFATYAAIMRELGGQARVFGRAPRPILEFGTEPTDAEVESVRRAVRSQIDPRDFEDPLRREVLTELKHTGMTDPEFEEVRQRLLDASFARAAEADELYEAFERAIHADDHYFAWSQWEWWLREEIERMRERADPIVRRLWEHGDYRPIFEAFLASVERDHDTLPDPQDLRCWLALYRAVLPLSDWDETWEIERSWMDLREDGDLEAYLKASLMREDLLLKPRRDEERVRRADPPISIAEWRGRFVDIEDDPGSRAVDLGVYELEEDDSQNE